MADEPKTTVENSEGKSGCASATGSETVSLETISADIKDCTKGEATIHPAMPLPIFGGRKCVVVGIIGSKKVLAICGDSGAADEKESIANAIRIATDWNERNAKSPNAPHEPCGTDDVKKSGASTK